jgi:hypothetical protein
MPLRFAYLTGSVPQHDVGISDPYALALHHADPDVLRRCLTLLQAAAAAG